jgi:hypothetical protein
LLARVDLLRFLSPLIKPDMPISQAVNLIC